MDQNLPLVSVRNEVIWATTTASYNSPQSPKFGPYHDFHQFWWFNNRWNRIQKTNRLVVLTIIKITLGFASQRDRLKDREWCNKTKIYIHAIIINIHDTQLPPYGRYATIHFVLRTCITVKQLEFRHSRHGNTHFVWIFSIRMWDWYVRGGTCPILHHQLPLWGWLIVIGWNVIWYGWINNNNSNNNNNRGRCVSTGRYDGSVATIIIPYHPWSA
jgi:hypothetical protein